MSRWITWTVVILALSAAAAGVGSVLLARAACRAATGHGAIRDFRQFTAEQLEGDVRSRVPLESSRVLVEGFLTGEGMEFSYDPSLNALLANAPCLKGSGIVMTSLGLTFRFDGDSKLKAIESHVNLTGP
jgi:hypothetical protein